MTGYFHQPTLPVSIFLENISVEKGHFATEQYDLKISLDASAQHLCFEPFISIIRHSLKNKTDQQISDLLELPSLFAVLKPTILGFINDEAPVAREPLNTDEVTYEQLEIFKAIAYVLQTVIHEHPLKVAVINAQYLSPSSLELLQKEEYRTPSQLHLDLFLPTVAFQHLKNSQGFATQIKRRHLTAPLHSGSKVGCDTEISIEANPDHMWRYLQNATALYGTGELLSITDYINGNYELSENEKSEIVIAQLHAWLLLKDNERCHIYMQELQNLDFEKLSVESGIQVHKATCIANLCLNEYGPPAVNACAKYGKYSLKHHRPKDALLADFYSFISKCFSGELKYNAIKINKLCKGLTKSGWHNLAAFVKCSLWFNQSVLDDAPQNVIDSCLDSIHDYEKLNNIIGQSTAHHHISIVLGSTGQPKEAIKHINRALKLTQQCGLSVRIHNTLNGLSFLLNGLGQSNAAREAIEAAYPLVLSDGNFDQICTTLYNLSLVAFYANHLQSTIQLIDDIFTIMEYRNMSATRFRKKEEILALQAIAAYLNGDRRLPFAIRSQVEIELPKSHEGEAFIRCIGLITQDFNADEAEHFFIEISEQFSKLRQNIHLELLALRLLIAYLKDIGEHSRATTWAHQGIKQCRAYQLECRESWFKDAPNNPIMNTTIEPKQAITMAQRQLGIDALKLENGLLNTLAAFNESALRSSTVKELIDTFLSNMQKLINVSQATINLKLANGDKINQHIITNTTSNNSDIPLQHLTFDLHFIGGTGTLTVSFLGDLIAHSHDAHTIVLKICDRLSRSIEFILDRLDSYRLAYHDSLTSIYNRAAFEEDIERILSQDETNKISLAFIDLDKFKLVNDTHGHLVGDNFLKSFVDMLTAKIRADDRIYRLGGDEFLVCFQDIRLKKAEQILKRFIDAFFNSRSLKSLGVQSDMDLGCSIGLIEYHPNKSTKMSIEELIATVDDLMYQAKRSPQTQILSQVLN